MKSELSNTSSPEVPVNLNTIGFKRPFSSIPRIGLRFSERILLLSFGDLFIVNMALFISLVARSKFEFAPAMIWQQLPWFILLSLLWLAISVLWDAYNLVRNSNIIFSLIAAGGTAVLSTGLYLLIPYLTPTLPSRRLYLFMFPLLTVFGVLIWRLFYGLVLGRTVFKRTALVIGAGQSAQLLAQAVTEGRRPNSRMQEGSVYTILGFVDNDPDKQNKYFGGFPVLGRCHNLVNLVHELQPDELIVATTDLPMIQNGLFNAILECREQGISIRVMTSLYERVTGRVPIEHAGYYLDVVLPVSRPASYRFYLVARQIVEFSIALLGCVFLVVLIPPIWLANLFTSPGNIFYRQERVGKGGKSFQLLKFRSMSMNAEKETGAVWACKNDKRITGIGRILRRIRLDEVPQFWNVLKGEMSVIGPRPERPSFVKGFSDEIPFYRIRHAIKPGITGWAQVQYRYGASTEDALIKLQYDLYYIKHQSLNIDLLILLKTIQVMLGLKGQ
ncbi:MAG: sugar transferase [Chloroflexi bacterium]|nr:MAG: sugar transferase [Chloroflexota bacterium]